MEFEANRERSFKVGDFYTHFRRCLPKLAIIISGGFRGKNNDDTLYSGEVIAVVSKTHGEQELSSSKHGPNECVEVYRLEEGKICEIPFYLPTNIRELELDIAEVIGIKGQSKEQWKAYQQYIKSHFKAADPFTVSGQEQDQDAYESCSSIGHVKPKPKFQLHKTIRMIKKKLIGGEGSSPMESGDSPNKDLLSSDPEYPTANTTEISDTTVESTVESTVDTYTDYEQPVTQNAKKDYMQVEVSKPAIAPKPKLPSTSSSPNPPTQTQMMMELNTALKSRIPDNTSGLKDISYVKNISRENVRPFNPAGTEFEDPHEEKLVKTMYTNERALHTDQTYHNLPEGQLDDVYQNVKLGIDEHYLNKSADCRSQLHDGNKNTHTSNNPSYLNPTHTSPQPSSKKDCQMHSATRNLTEVGASVKNKMQNTGTLTPEDVQHMSIEEVGHYLKVLNLNKYVDEFERNQIDGALLSSLDEDVFTSEFEMKRFEAIKLMNFAKHGRIPFSRKSVTGQSLWST